MTTKTPIKPTAQFRTDAGRMSRDLRHRGLVQTAMGKYEAVRRGTQARFRDWQAARQAASEAKWEALNHLDQYLEEFARNAEARGTRVFWAATGEEARDYVLDVCRRAGARQLIKSKTMTSEEIHLNPALEAAGYGVVESDLGEYIVQLRGEAPYHLVFPAMHLTRGEISDIFSEKLGTPASDSPEALTMIARDVLRGKYISADVGISGANFAVAETGMISITENEGNARLTTSVPRVHIALIGIEKVLPKMADLALFLPMLATAGTGQALTCYNSLIGGPRQEGESDGPDEFHVVLLDNGRTELLADPEQRDALHCIRCGACLNVCPIFRNVGGHSYGTTYQGPIGSVITPHLRGLQAWKHLSSASTLCGACTETCPVGIDLHHHLLQNRRNAARARPDPGELFAYRGFAFLMRRPRLYRLALRLAPLLQRLQRLVGGRRLDPLYAWTQSRDFPAAQRRTFKDYWAARTGGELMGTRAQILGRIRRALQVPAPKRHAPDPSPTTERYARGLPVIRQEARAWLPPVGETWEEQAALFASNCADLRAEFHLCADRAELGERLAALAAESGWRRVASHPGALTDACTAALALPTLITERGYDMAGLEQCDAALTECDALVAQTGSVLITSRSAGGRTLSALTPHHVVLATRDQLVPDMTAALALLSERYGDDYPSLMSFITGPSRTGDIERILVLGAHGPKRLTIFCV